MEYDKKPTGMFVQPTIDYKSEEWIAMIYGGPSIDSKDNRFLVGFAFQTEQYARQFYELLKSYNNGEIVDRDDNIKISFIPEGPKDYSVYVYPSHERPVIKEFEKEMNKDRNGNASILITNLTMCKSFPYGPNSSFRGFKELYTPGNLVEISVFVIDGNKPREIDGIEPIIKTDLKIKYRKRLSKNEDPVEYEHGKSIMGK